jgi:hypothetical protein
VIGYFFEIFRASTADKRTVGHPTAIMVFRSGMRGSPVWTYRE